MVPHSVLEASGSGGLYAGNDLINSCCGRGFERREKIRLENFAPRCGDLTGKGSGKLNIEVATPGAMTAKS